MITDDVKTWWKAPFERTNIWTKNWDVFKTDNFYQLLYWAISYEIRKVSWKNYGKTFKNISLTYVFRCLPNIWDLGIFFWDHWLSSLYHWKEVERDTILYFYKKKSAKSKLSVYERGSLEERVQSNSATNWQSHDSQSVW